MSSHARPAAKRNGCGSTVGATSASPGWFRGGAVVDSPVGSTPIRAIVAAEWVSSIGSSMTVLALPVVRARDDWVGNEAGARSRHRQHPVRHAAPPCGLADRPDRGKADDDDRGRGATSAARCNPGALQSRRAVVPAARRAGRPHERVRGGSHARPASDPGRGGGRRRGEPRRSRERVPRRCANDCARSSGPRWRAS